MVVAVAFGKDILSEIMSLVSAIDLMEQMPLDFCCARWFAAGKINQGPLSHDD